MGMMPIYFENNTHNDYLSEVRTRVRYLRSLGFDFKSSLLYSCNCDIRLWANEWNAQNGMPTLTPLPVHDMHSNSVSTKNAYLDELINDMKKLLPEPSPVYSQWWFSREVYDKTIGFLSSLLTNMPPKCCFIGASTLGAMYSATTKRSTTIIDIDREVLRTIANYCRQGASIIESDVNAPDMRVLKDKFSSVFIDPPWGSSSLKRFIINASTLVCNEGYLLTSLPPALTRPNIMSERHDLEQELNKLGFTLEHCMYSYTNYETPKFEAVAYADLGIQENDVWRHGDLFVFKKSKRIKKTLPIELSDYIPEKWNQYSFGKARVFLRNQEFSSHNHNDFPAWKPLALPARDTSSRNKFYNDAPLVSTRNCFCSVYNRSYLANMLSRYNNNTELSLIDDHALRDLLGAVITLSGKNIMGGKL